MKINIAVTGLNATESPGPGLGVIKCLREAKGFDVSIIGLAYDVKDPAIYLNGICDQVFLIPFPSSGPEGLKHRLEYVFSKTKIDLLIPSLDSELKSFIQLQPFIESHGIKMLLPDEDMLQTREKKHLREVCTKGKISYPRTTEINGYDHLEDFAEKLGYPLFVKGVFYEAVKVKNLQELEKAMEDICSRWGFPVLLQEDISGEEFDIAAVGDGSGKVLGVTPMRKMQLTSKGKAWGGMTLDSAEIMTAVKRIIKTLKWRGPTEIEIMKRKKDGKLFLIEINPRFPAWIYLSAGAGCNLPGLMLDHLFGKCPPKPISAVPGVIFLRAAEDHICSMNEYEQMLVSGEMTRKSFS
jgi:carbamoyl-phosphate synthase large subunit